MTQLKNLLWADSVKLIIWGVGVLCSHSEQSPAVAASATPYLS
jgi:hypothetical protein